MQLKGIVVESTFNWYWLIYGLMDTGYHCVHLANPSNNWTRGHKKKRMLALLRDIECLLTTQPSILSFS